MIIWMKNYNIKEFSFIKTPIVIEFTCIVILVYLFMSKHNDYLGVAVCLLVLIQQIYLIYRGMKFFYEFVNDIQHFTTFSRLTTPIYKLLKGLFNGDIIF